MQRTVPELLEATKQGELKVVIGGLTQDSPGAREQKEAGLTNACPKTGFIVGVPSDQGMFDDLSGRRVAVERIDRAAAELKKRGAISVRVDDLSTPDCPVAHD